MKKLEDEYAINTKTNKVYYNDIPIMGADAKTFETLGNNYAKDKYAVYYKGQKMKNVQNDKFKVINGDGDHKLS